jgi:hypothetical protein
MLPDISKGLNYPPDQDCLPGNSPGGAAVNRTIALSWNARRPTAVASESAAFVSNKSSITEIRLGPPYGTAFL